MTRPSMLEHGIHLAYFDPGRGHVPNPGMGLQAYVFSDHMHHAFDQQAWRQTERTDPNRPLDRSTLERMVQLPYVDNLYFRVDWNRVQQEPGRLTLPREWEWMLDAVEAHGKRWSFRIMNASKHSAGADSIPAFLADELETLEYRNDYAFGPPRKRYPAYTDAYLRRWRELMELFAERYDDHPLLEFVDVSGFGMWGEGHHYAAHTDDGPVINIQPPGSDEAVRRLLADHLDVFARTPVAMTLHLLDFPAGVAALADGDVWMRRDSFQPFTSTAEYHAMADRVPGRAAIWETLVPAITGERPPIFSLERQVQRFLDFTAHYVAVGFNPWDVIIAHDQRVELYEQLAERIGYRLRPAVVWRLVADDGSQELVVALANDGTADVPGTLTLTAHFADGSESAASLEAGRPHPGDRILYRLPIPPSMRDRGSEVDVALSLRIRMRGKEHPVRWAVRQRDVDPFRVRMPLRTPPPGDPFLTPTGPYDPSL